MTFIEYDHSADYSVLKAYYDKMLDSFGDKTIEEEQKIGIIDFLVNYKKRSYAPNCWKVEMKSFLDFAVAKNRNAEE